MSPVAKSPRLPLTTSLRRRRAFRFCVLLTGLGVGVLFGEILLRWFDVVPDVQAIDLHDPRSPYQRSDNAVLRYELRPGFTAPLAAQHECLRLTETEFAQDGSSAVSGTVTVNSHGLRDRERSVKRSGGGQRIVLLGDSVVEMINYVSDESTITRLLEAKYDDGTEVLNVGTAGYCTRAEVELLQRKGLAFQPDVVVVLFVENDYWGYNLEHAIGATPIDRPALVNQLFVASDLFRAASLQLNLFGFADEQNPAKWHREAVGENNVVGGFRLLQQLSEVHDFRVIVAFWPSFLKDAIGYRYVLEGTGELVAEPIAWQFGFQTVRLDDRFRQHWSKLKPQPQPEWYYTCGDGMHPSVRGCEIAADSLYDLLQADGSAPAASMALVTPSDVAGRTEKFERASAVAEMLALEPEVMLPLTEQISMTMKRQNRFVDAETFSASGRDRSPEELNELLASKPNTSADYFQAGVQFVSRSQLFAARDMFERVVALDARNLEAQMFLVEIYLELKLPGKAKTTLMEVLRMEPNHAEAKAFLAEMPG